MIIGRGSIASIIEDREGFIFFACGESNRFPLTAERRAAEARRLLEKKYTDKMLVYISGLNIYYKEGDGRSEYTNHKLNMERLVKNNFVNYCIFRLGSITWGDNPNTIVNFMKAQIAADPSFKGREVYRYLHTKEELAHWFSMIPRKGQHDMNVTGALTWVPDLVQNIKDGKL